MVAAYDLEADVAAVETASATATGFGQETTRYLCGAAYRDIAFRAGVLRRNREIFRARAPEAGVDVDMVTAHCLSARKLDFVRNLVISAATAVLVVALIASRHGPPPILLGLFALLAAWGAAIFHAFRIDDVLRSRLTRDAFQQQKQQPDPRLECGNVVVYSGFSPFVGSGSDLGGWSFAIDLDRGKRDSGSPRPCAFTLAELYDRMGRAFTDLNIRNLSLSRKIFVNGRSIRGSRLFLPDIHRRPVSQVEADVIAKFAESGSMEYRHYLCVETVDWNGELVVTIFIRFRKLSSKLFVEVSSFLLTPLKSNYYDLDKVHPIRRPSDFAALVAGATIATPFLMIASPFLVLGAINGRMAESGHERTTQKEIDEDLLFDYGAAQSLRESAASTNWRIYFQRLDKEMHVKILQQQLVDTLLDFLDEHGVDTSDIKERTVHILNNGLIVSGGSINAQGLAVGSGAEAKVTNALREAREKVSA